MSSERLPLPTALQQIADGAAATQESRQVAGAGLPLAQMHTAARRRRVTFGAGVAVGAAAVVGVLVLGAAAAGGLIDRDPVPPVQTPDSAAWDVDYSRCGGPLAAPDPATSSGPAVLFSAGPAEADSQALLTVSTLVATTEAEPSVIQQVGTRHDVVVLNRDDFTVVGVMGTPTGGDGPDELVAMTEETAYLITTAPLFSCASPDGRTRLEPGDYYLEVGRLAGVVVGGTRQEQRVTTGPEVTVPEPAGNDVETLATAPLTGPVPQCGAAFAAPASGSGDVEVGVQLSASVMPGAGGGTVRSSVDTTLTLIDTGAPGGAMREIEAGSPRALLVQDGVVVDVASGGTLAVPVNAMPRFPVPLVPGTTRRIVVAFTGFCPNGDRSGLADGAYEVWVAVSFDDGETLAAGPWPLELTAGAWAPVDLSAIPADVPIIDERVLRSEASDDGARWRVTLQLNNQGSAGYMVALDALTAGGFNLDLETTDPTRPAWNYAELSNDTYLVTLDVSNETGEGFYADYVITRR